MERALLLRGERSIQKHMWWQGEQSERVVCYKSTGMEETNTSILELRYLFVHKVLVMSLKCAVAELLKATN